MGLRLEKIEKAVDHGHAEIAEREIAKLRKQIAELPQGSVVIKEAAPALSRLNEDNFWITLNNQRLDFLRKEIKPLFRTVSEADFKAMRFERDVLEYSLAKLCNEKPRADTLKESIVEEISELPLSVSFVKTKESLIRTAQSNSYWTRATPIETEQALDDLVAKLGPLIKFRDQNSGPGPVHLNLTDTLVNKECVEFGPQHAAALGGVAATVLATSSAEAAGDNSGYFVIAEIAAPKEKADQLRALLVPFSEISAREPGCLKYVLMEAIGEPGRFLTYERWTNKAALDAHMATKDIKEIVPKARADPRQAGHPDIPGRTHRRLSSRKKQGGNTHARNNPAPLSAFAVFGKGPPGPGLERRQLELR